MIWNPHTYLAYSDLRERPAVELLARVPRETIGLAYDMGCGTGNSTRLLHLRWPEARIVGVDNSETMLKEARESGDFATWRRGDLNEYFPDDGPDLIYSNAAYHWIDNHKVIFSKLAECLKPGGVLAIQMPANFDALSHVLLHETAAQGPWSAAVADIRPRNPVHGADEYYDMLCHAFEALDIWTTQYLQLLTGNDPVLNWVKGTALVPYLEALEGELREGFLEAYSSRLRESYPMRPDGTTLFPFKRLFIVGRR